MTICPQPRSWEAWKWLDEVTQIQIRIQLLHLWKREEAWTALV
jgi:hypothetical protein